MINHSSHPTTKIVDVTLLLNTTSEPNSFICKTKSLLYIQDVSDTNELRDNATRRLYLLPSSNRS